MKQIKLRYHIGDDGILHLDIPSEFKGVDVDVSLTVTMQKVNESNEDLEEDISQLGWHEFIEKTYGCLADDPIIRYPQSEYPQRETLE